MSFEIKPAVRTSFIPIVSFHGKSGSGKTLSALKFARGFVGPKGKIRMIDTENRRGSIFADLIPGGYEVLDLDEPFNPMRCAEAIEAAEPGSDIVVFDSFSHSWAGPGGVLEMAEAELDRMAGDNWGKREACKMASWIKPKLENKAMVSRLLRCKVPLIVCLRGEEKTHMEKVDGKTKVHTDDFTTPIADPRFIFEVPLRFETIERNGQGGFVIPRKICHPTVIPLLPGENEQIDYRHGEALARWCAGAGEPAKAEAAPAASKPKSSLPALKRQLWAVLESIRHGAKDEKQAVSQWLWDEAILGDQETLDGLDEQRLAQVVSLAEVKIKQQGHSDVPTP